MASQTETAKPAIVKGHNDQTEQESSTMNSILLVFPEGFTLPNGMAIDVQLQRKDHQVKASSTVAVHAVLTTIPVPFYVKGLAKKLQAADNTMQPEERITRAYRLGQDSAWLPLGEGSTSLPANDQGAHMRQAHWLAFKFNGDITSYPYYLTSRQAVDQCKQAARKGILVIGFASKCEAEACLIGAGFSMDQAKSQDDLKS